jgi:hypothetical protein
VTSPSGESWERRAAEFATEVQRWLIKVSARSMRDEIGGQVRRAFGGPEPNPDEVWAVATTEPPDAATEPPECAWCPVCRAARRITRSRDGSTGTPGLSEAAEVMAGAVRDALAGLDSILSYRSPGAPEPEADSPADPSE